MRPPSQGRRNEATRICSPGGGHPSLPIRCRFHHRPVWRAGPGLGKSEGAGGSSQVPAPFPAPRPLEALAGAPTGPGQGHGGPWSSLQPRPSGEDSVPQSGLCRPQERCHLAVCEAPTMARSLTWGCCPWCLTEEEKTAARIDQEINKILLEQKKRERGELKLLLLGECGLRGAGARLQTHFLDGESEASGS